MTHGRETFAVLLRRYRAAAGLSQEELAERAGLSRRGISDLERGLRSSPYPATVRRLAEALTLADSERMAMLEAASQSAQRPYRRSLGTVELGTTRQVERLRVVPDARQAARISPPGAPWPNLPRWFTPFIGRELELNHLRGLLVDHDRRTSLITLVGTGGVGKTRLALEVAVGLPAATFPDGIWLVELAQLSDPKWLTQVVAATLSLQVEGRRPVTDVLIDALRMRRMLLLLDNCEHLAQACAALAERIVRSCPGVRILATSREALSIPGEVILQVPPLACPAAGPTVSLDALQDCEAVRLFVDRAGAASSDFQLEPRNAAAIARICQRLEGLPLALELAAARVRALAVEHLEQLLERSVPLLATGNRAAARRQQTLEASLAWSYDLLSDTEQRLFTRLAVFAGGWTLEAAQEVCSDDGLPAEEIPDLLARLIDKSLAIANQGVDGGNWYRLLQPIRQFALGRLGQSGVGRVRNRHLAFYVGLAEESERVLRFTRAETTLKLRWVAFMQLQQDNLRSAWQWAALGAGDVEHGLRMAAAQLTFWYIQGYFAEGRAQLRTLLERDQDAIGPLVRARALSAAAALAAHESDDHAAALYAAAYLRLSTCAAIARVGAPAHSALGLIALRLGNFPEARARLTLALSLARSAGEATPSLYLTGLATVALAEGDLGTAQRLGEEALEEARASDFLLGSAQALEGLGRVAYSSGDLARATTLLAESASLLGRIGAMPRLALVLVMLAHLAREAGNLPGAQTRFMEALRACASVGDSEGLTATFRGIGLLLLDHPERAPHTLADGVKMLGAASARQQHGAAQPDSSVEIALARARTGLGAQNVADLLEEGRSLPLEVAVAQARAVCAAALTGGLRSRQV